MNLEELYTEKVSLEFIIKSAYDESKVDCYTQELDEVLRKIEELEGNYYER